MARRSKARHKDPGWRHVTIHFTSNELLEEMAFPLACKVADRLRVPLYYARYSVKTAKATVAVTAEPSLELKLKSRLGLSTLQRLLRGLVNAKAIHSIDVKLYDGSGSMGHALMFQVARELYDKPKEQLVDCCHWLTNMVGMNYIDEAAFYTQLGLIASAAVHAGNRHSSWSKRQVWT